MLKFGIVVIFIIAARQVECQPIEPFQPDCSTCEFYNGIGYIKSPAYCRVYAMCVRNPYKANDFKFTIMCCNEGQEFNEEHLTCEWNTSETCLDDTDLCPVPQTTPEQPLPCPNFPDPADPTKYFVPSQEWMMCAPGFLWIQELCTCNVWADIHDDVVRCDKILDFDFEDGSFDSYSCNNFAAAEKYGTPLLKEGVLCLNGEDAFIGIPYLNNLFAWNPIMKTFTLSFWFLPSVPAQTAALFASNCSIEADPNSIFLIGMNGGVLFSSIGGSGPIIQDPPIVASTDSWTNVVLTLNTDRKFNLYANGALVHEHAAAPDVYFNTQIHATLGFSQTFRNVNGYFDDFRFWSRDLDADEIGEAYLDGPSNNFSGEDK